MHFTLSPFGSAGDVHPFLGLALALRERGHEITFITSGYFEQAVRRHGLHYVELGSEAEFLEALENPDLWSMTRSFAHVFQSIAAVFREHYALLLEEQARQPTVAVSSCLGFGARIAQEHRQIPLVSVHLQPAVIFSKQNPPMLSGYRLPRWFTNVALATGERFVIDPIARPDINRFRAELGLPPMRHLLSWWHSTQQNVCLFPDWFAEQQADWPAGTVQTDFPLWDDGNHEPLPEDVEAFLSEGTPPIVFTPGSANVHGQDFFRIAAEASARCGRRAMLMSRFPEQIPKDLPAGVQHFDYAPFAQLLPRTAAIVHHGGVGTTAQGLAAGIPQLIMGLAHDQFDNGARVQQMGVGTWLTTRQFRPPRVARLLQDLLNSTDVAQRCAQVASRLTVRDGLARAAEAMETFAREVQQGNVRSTAKRTG